MANGSPLKSGTEEKQTTDQHVRFIEAGLDENRHYSYSSWIAILGVPEKYHQAVKKVLLKNKKTRRSRGHNPISRGSEILEAMDEVDAEIEMKDAVKKR